MHIKLQSEGDAGSIAGSDNRSHKSTTSTQRSLGFSFNSREKDIPEKEPKDDRQQLFENAERRLQRVVTRSYSQDRIPTSFSYGGRMPTTQEQEEEEWEVQVNKRQMRATKEASIASTRRALQATSAAEQSGLATLEHLNRHAEILHHTEQNLHEVDKRNDIAKELTRDLKQENRSPFMPRVRNPFGMTDEEKGLQVREKHQDGQLGWERSVRESRERQRAMWAEMERLKRSGKEAGTGAWRFSQYQFEADDSDDEIEEELDSNLWSLNVGASRLRIAAAAIGKEVQVQNNMIDCISMKVSCSWCAVSPSGDFANLRID